MSINTSFKEPAICQPNNLKIILYDHQLASIYKMERMEMEKKIIKKDCVKEFSIGINADPTGYGKTLSTIGLILRDKMEWDLNLPYIEQNMSFNTNLVKTHIIKRFEKINCNLILVSPSIIQQWEKEFEYTDIKVLCVNTKKKLENIEIQDFDVILVTISMYNYIAQMFSKYAWKRFIFDEPANIRVPNMKKVNAGFYWFITATPYGIWQKHYKCSNSFIKNIIGNDYFEFKKDFDDLIIRNDMDFINKSFSMPSSLNYYHICSQPLLIVVKDFVTPSIKRMLEANDIEGVISILGGQKTDNLIELIKNNKSKEIKELEIKQTLYKIRNNSKMLGKCDNQIVGLKKEIEEMDKRFNNFIENNCSICLNKLKNPVLEHNCSNIFCSNCLLTWLNKINTCPLCREDVNIKKLVYVTDKKTNKKTIPNKQEMILNLIKKYDNGKFLIFSEYNATFETIEELLKDNNINFTQLKGNSNTRSKNIDKFKNGNISVIFLNSNYDGSGINLQETTDIILYHKMSKELQTQIIGRARRIGRKKILRIHHLIVNI